MNMQKVVQLYQSFPNFNYYLSFQSKCYKSNFANKHRMEFYCLIQIDRPVDMIEPIRIPFLKDCACLMICLDYQQLQMGNQNVKAKQRETNQRRTLLNRIKQDQPDSTPSRRKYSSINQSLEVPSSAQPRQKYHSINYTQQQSNQDVKSIHSDRRRSKQDAQNEQILQKLSKKNQQLRHQLKQISELLTQQLQRKKFVPKKKVQGTQGEDNEDTKVVVNTAGLRRQLQNGYRQIEMYKRTIQALTGKEENSESDVRLKRLQNQISTIDSQINTYMKQIEGIKKIKKGQDRCIEKDINDDLIGGVVAFKKQAEDIKNTLKDFSKRERQREVNYKKQQAYLFEVQKKWRDMNGDYFPELKKRNGAPLPVASRVVVAPKQTNNQVSSNQLNQVSEELNLLKAKHDDYNKKINGIILQKNKISDDQSVLDQNIKYSDRVIDALKLKLIQIKKIALPTKKSLFGSDSNSINNNNNNQGNDGRSEYNGGGVSEIERQMQQQINQDQFDIKHLIANIPKPAKQKVVIQFMENSKRSKKKGGDPNNGMTKQVSQRSGDKGMIISGQKSQPKKWGSALTRSDEKGHYIKKQTIFEDSTQFAAEDKPMIVGINIWVNKNNSLLGIQAVYLNNGQIRYGSKSSNGIDGFIQRYDLQSPDYLKNVAGAISQQGFIEYLILSSKLGKVTTFGFKHESQQAFNFGISSSQRPFRIAGASFLFDSQPRLTRLGLQICQD